MLPYWLIFSLWAVGSLQTERRAERDLRLAFFIAAAAATTLFVGLRFEVGGDWSSYIRMFNSIFFLSLPDAMRVTDPGYALVNWGAASLGLDVTLVNLVCAIIFTAGVSRLAWRQPNPALAMLIAIPYLVIVVAMGYTRQAAAIGLVCFAVTASSERHLVRLIVLVGLASMFHKTAILILPIALRPILQRNLFLGAIGGLAFATLFYLVLRNSSDTLITNYVSSSYDSQGALIRVLMTVVPAILYFFYADRITSSSFERSFWRTCAMLAIVCLAGLAIASASSGIDRISLYLIPLQIIVYSNLPYLLSRTGKAQPSLIIATIAYCFMVQYVWLNFADNASAWIPYRMTLGLSAVDSA